MINDVLEIIPQKSERHINSIDDKFVKKTAIIFMRELFSDLKTSDDPKLDVIKSNILPQLKTINDIISDLIHIFRDDPFLEEIIEVYRIESSLFPPVDVHECNNFLTICKILRKARPEERYLAYSCLRCIKTCIKEFEVLYD
ncbi:hypothetical protein RF11_06721 [Thelohanellus kitauei]|uniref:Uncharacterized protein n=1 Tax=Thelohanellus kitauei TaxID=669202 RepID=A0A0C2MM37_THEKT|nr:hypothetical protein RF11_06721 [Thelohanellus kitauei]